METQLNLVGIISDPVIEQYKADLRNDLQTYATVQATYDSQKRDKITEAYVKVQIVDYVRIAGQKAIYAIRSRLLNYSSISNAREVEQIAQKNNIGIVNKMNDRDHVYETLKTKRDNLPVNHFKRKWVKRLLWIGLALGIIDGVIMFTNIASGGYPLAISFLGALVLASIIAFSHNIYLPWVYRGTNVKKRTERLLLVLGSALIVFSVFGHIRSYASNANAGVNIPGSEIITSSSPATSGWIIALISFAAFFLVFMLAKVLWRNPEEMKTEELYNVLADQMQEQKQELNALQEKKDTNDNAPILLKQEARFKHDLFYSSVAECRSICYGAINKYYQVYSRNTPNVPEFFSKQIILAFDESIDLSNHAQTA